MSSPKPWSPDIGGSPLLHPFTSPDGDRSHAAVTLRDPEHDTAPLQGTKDISDQDSLEDVIADAESEEHVPGP
jgi:hypothetical protein